MAGFDAKLLSAAADNKASGSSSRFGTQSCGIGLESKYFNALFNISLSCQFCGLVPDYLK